MAEILSSGPDQPRWRPPRWKPARWMIAAGVTVAAAAVLVAGVMAAAGPDGSRRAGRARASSSSSRPVVVFPDGPDAPVTAGRTPGLVITWAAVERGSAWDQRDRASAAGPWTLTVRRRDGSLARHSAVVTFPVSEPGSGTGRAGEITWRVGGSYARVRGDLPSSQLAGIAAATTVKDGRPQVLVPPSGLTVAATGPARSRDLREVRYRSQDAGEAAALSDGVTFTGVVRCGGFEDRLYVAKARAAGTVHGKPAVVTSTLSGDGLLAWEPAPGVVAYVGYSGTALTARAVAALHRIADRTRLLTTRQWRATGSRTTDGVNDFG